MRPRVRGLLTGAAVLVACACSPGAPTSPATPVADADGLVKAQHPQCDVGQRILRYLATGDNGGQPALDQRFANYVGVPPAQARAIADKAIQDCDQQVYTQESQAAVVSSEAQALASRAARENAAASALAAQEAKSCAAIGGRFSDDRCYSTVKGNPSGQPGVSCVFPDGTPIWLTFDSDGSVRRGEYQTSQQNYPGCFR